MKIYMLVGSSGSGKSMFSEILARNGAKVISSDRIREDYFGDFRRQDMNAEVFRIMREVADRYVSMGNSVVLDAMHLKPRDRKYVLDISSRYGITPVAVVIDRPLECKIADRGWRPEWLVRKTHDAFVANATDKNLVNEGFDVIRNPVMNDFQNIEGSIRWVVPDIHSDSNVIALTSKVHDRGERMIFMGDICDTCLCGDHYRPVDVMDHVIDMVDKGHVHIMGNHDSKLDRYLDRWDSWRGHLKYGLSHTVSDIRRRSETVRRRIQAHLKRIPHAYIQRDNKTGRRQIFVHAAIHPSFWKDDYYMASDFEGPVWFTREAFEFAIYGQTDGFEGDFPRRIYDWSENVPADVTVYIGHDIVDVDGGKPDIIVNGQGGKVVRVDNGVGKVECVAPRLVETIY